MRSLVSGANQFAFVLIHYVALAITILLTYSIGRRLTRRLNYHSTFESIVFSISFGLGVIAYAILFLGLIRLLYVHTLVAALLLLFAFGFPELRELRKLRFSKGVIFAFLSILVLATPILMLPLYPPTRWDATAYHLASAKIFATEHAVTFTPYLRYAVAPMLNQMLFTGALLAGDGPFAQLIELLLFALLLVALFAFSQRHLNDRSGLLAMALVASSPYIIILATIAYIDLGLMHFCFLGCFAFWNWWTTRESAWLVASGVGLGLAISTKYPALFFVALLVALLSASALVLRRSFPLRKLFVLGGIALLVASPWLIRNFYYTRNPIFPFLHDLFGPIFGYGLWGPENYAGQGGRGLNEGLGRGWRELVMLPWNLTVRPEAFAGEFVMSRLYLPILPFAIFGALKLKAARFVMSVALAFTLFWFFTYQSLRYLLPAVPFYCLAAAGGIELLLSRWKTSARIFGNPWAIAIVCTVILLPGLEVAVREVTYNRWRIPATTEKQEKYISERLPTYHLYKYLNQLKGRNYRVYAFLDENMTYYADGVHMGDVFGPARFSLVEPKLGSGEALWRQLRALGADYFIFTQSRFKVPRPDDAFFHTHFRPILYVEDAVLYELR
jgi:4-amino-4-deoxy-L-arabinose transferase-like glycosyltransferase